MLKGGLIFFFFQKNPCNWWKEAFRSVLQHCIPVLGTTAKHALIIHGNNGHLLDTWCIRSSGFDVKALTGIFKLFQSFNSRMIFTVRKESQDFTSSIYLDGSWWITAGKVIARLWKNVLLPAAPWCDLLLQLNDTATGFQIWHFLDYLSTRRNWTWRHLQIKNRNCEAIYLHRGENTLF